MSPKQRIFYIINVHDEKRIHDSSTRGQHISVTYPRQ